MASEVKVCPSCGNSNVIDRETNFTCKDCDKTFEKSVLNLMNKVLALVKKNNDKSTANKLLSSRDLPEFVEFLEEAISKYKKKICSECDALVRVSAKFCENCGARLSKRRGKSVMNVKCVICHEPIYNTKNAIKCTFCDSKYHRLCARSWMSKHNKCPTCLNAYIVPKNYVLNQQFLKRFLQQ